MPLMVDDHSIMDSMDDLFGDGDNEGLNAALAATLDSDVLRQRVEESHILGCCQKLAWSKNGSVAHISHDGRSISLRALVRERATAKWMLCHRGKNTIIAQGDACFTHIEWSTTGVELVAIDQFGRLYIYAMAHALNRVLPHALNYTVPHDDLSAVVGLHWLPPNQGPQRVPIVSPATKSNHQWTTTMAPYQYQVAGHPFDNKSAFLCMTRSNQLKLITQQQNQPWSESILELGELNSSSGIVTHASFADVQGQILLTTYDDSKCLRLYRLNILWNPVQGDPQHGQHATVSPALRVTHIQLLDQVLPQTSTGAELSHILIQPPSAAADKGPVLVLAIFTCLPDDQQVGHQAGERGSIISRWELRQSEVVLHDVFRTLKPGTEKLTVGKARETLHRLEDVATPKIYLAITDNLYHNIVACTSSDGTVDFRERENLNVIIADGDSNRAASLPQAGFSFMQTECTDIALSPTGCVAAISKQDGSVELHTADYLHGWTDAKSDHFLPQAAVVALAREAGILMCHSLVTDDILTLLPPDINVGLRRKFIIELLRIVSKNTDYSQEEGPAKDKGKVMKDALLFKALSMQLVLGYTADPAKRDIPGKVAWTLMNLRSCASNIAATMSMNVGQHQTPDLMISLRSLARWYIDLTHLLINDLFTLQRYLATVSSTNTKSTVLAHLAGTRSPALHLLLHSAPRNLLRFLTEIIKMYFQRAITCRPYCTTLNQRSQLNEIEALVHHQLGVKLPVFEQLLAEVDVGVRKAYAEAGVQGEPRGRSIAEASMIVEGDVPDALMPVVNILLGKGGLLTKFGERVDGVIVFSAETEWLGVSDDDTRRPGLVVDVVRKIELGSGCKKRICRRCGSVTEDLWEGRGLMHWVLASQRACVCYSSWVV